MPTFIVSLDRMMGFGFWSVSASQNGFSQTTSGVEGQLLVAATSPDAVPASVYHTPRIALEGVIGGGFTLGGSAGVMLANSSQSASGGGASTGGPGLFMFVVEPRIGYLVQLGDKFVFWPRAGFSAFEYSQSSTPTGGGATSTTSASGFAVDLEPTILLRALPTAGFSATALADIGVGGSFSQTGSTGGNIGVTSMNFGLTFGAFVGF